MKQKNNKQTLPFPKNIFEKQAWKNGMLTCGIDEVGRGCLAGPLVTAAVIIPQNCRYDLLQDSKVLTEQERNKAFSWIKKECSYTTAISSHQLIDKINIYQATIWTMKKAYIQLIEQIGGQFLKINYVLVDAVPLNLKPQFMHPKLEFHHFPKGETLSSSIAAASIVAKVTRDRLMTKLNQFFPAFVLDQHKGYGTKQHINIIKECGQSIIHRTTFTKNLTQPNDAKDQGSLF